MPNKCMLCERIDPQPTQPVWIYDRNIRYGEEHRPSESERTILKEKLLLELGD